MRSQVLKHRLLKDEDFPLSTFAQLTAIQLTLVTRDPTSIPVSLTIRTTWGCGRSRLLSMARLINWCGKTQSPNC